MTDSMIERVARALHDNDPASGAKWEDVAYWPEYQERRRKEARAAIEAMREPPAKALGALVAWAELSGNRVACEKDALLVWQDVFDVALETPQKPAESEANVTHQS